MKGNEQKQKQIIISAYKLEVIQKALNSTLSWLEFYIENSDYSGNWQRQTEPIKREDLAQSGRIRGFMETALLALDNVIENKPDFIAKKFQDQFYSWLDKSGINVNDCSEELTQSLLDIYNVLNNQGKEFVERTSNEAGENISRMTPEERKRNFYNTFIASQKMMEVAKARQKELEGKTYKDIEIKNPFSGNPDQGKKLFGQIKNKQSANPGSVNLDKVVENLKADPKNYWRLDEIPTEINNLGWAKKQEWLLIHWDAREKEFDNEGKLNFNNNPIYRWENFNALQRFEIKKALNISVDYLTDEEIKWVVREFKDNPRIWLTGTFKGHNCLIHNLAQGNDRENGTLIHNQKKFSKTEWAEINEALERVRLIDKIKQHISEFKFQMVLTFNGQYWDNINKRWVKYSKEKQETMLVHKSVKITENDYNEHGYLDIKTDKMFQENRFSQEEWVEIQSALKVDDIKRNAKLEKELLVINKETGEVSENEDWYINNELKREFDDKTGYLIYVPNLMIRAKDLTEAEQKEIGYKLETPHQVQTRQRDNNLHGGGSGWGGANKYVAGSLGIISLIGLVFTS